MAEAADAVWYVRPSSGGQFGPATPDVLREWLAQNRVGTDSLVWREGWRDWRQAAEVFPQLGAGRLHWPLMGVAPSPASATASAAVRGSRSVWRRKSDSKQATLIALLILAVLILFGVFVWVLTHQAEGQSGGGTGLRAVGATTCTAAGRRLPQTTKAHAAEAHS